MMRAQRDPATAEPLEKLWREIEREGNILYGLNVADVLVLADGLAENGHPAVAKDLSRFARKVQKWRESSIKEHGSIMHYHPGLPGWPEWRLITRRVGPAIATIKQLKPGRAWYQRRPHKALIIIRDRYGSSKDVARREILSASPTDLEDLTTIRKWLTKNKIIRTLGKARMDREGDRIVIFPHEGPHSIVIEPGRVRESTNVRELLKMAKQLREMGFKNPQQSARRLVRAGVEPHTVIYGISWFRDAEEKYPFLERVGSTSRPVRERDPIRRRRRMRR